MKHPPSLSSGRDFQRVISHGRVVRPQWATIHLAPSPTAGAPSRLGLAVPGRAGGAVQRNRVKRRIRAAFRTSAPAAGLDVVVRARPEAATAGFQQLEETLRGLAL